MSLNAGLTKALEVSFLTLCYPSFWTLNPVCVQCVILKLHLLADMKLWVVFFFFEVELSQEVEFKAL